MTFNKEPSHLFKKEPVKSDSLSQERETENELLKLNQEIELLKLQLQDEKNNNLKLNENLLRYQSIFLFKFSKFKITIILNNFL